MDIKSLNILNPDSADFSQSAGVVVVRVQFGVPHFVARL